MSAPGACAVCALVDPITLIELDTIMGDPAQWPATIWGKFSPPRGALPMSYQRFGAIEMGLAWCHDRGLDVNRTQVRRHYRYDVPKIATNPADLVATGLIVKGRKDVDPGHIVDPLAYLRYYSLGIEAGITGLGILLDRIETLKGRGLEVPMPLVKMAIDAGSKLATSQAAIRASGKPWGEEGDTDEGFRKGSAPEPGIKVSDYRARVIEGESQIVRDHGGADRAHYSERAAQEGGEGLPHP